jgi:hypothetical protein
MSQEQEAKPRQLVSPSILLVVQRFSLLLLFACLTVQSWRKWPDVLVDFGRELYLPWQLISGRVLYRDMDHLFGPLSVYYHGFLFKVFGVSYSVIILSNIIIAIILLIVVYKLLIQISSPAAAFVGQLFVVSVFLFSQFLNTGNYNFMSPYSHEASHGLVLSLLSIYHLWQYLKSAKSGHILIAGLIFGLVFLTKIEVFLSLMIAAGCFFALLLHHSRARGFKALALFVSMALLAPTFFFIYFLTVMPAAAALKGLFGSWLILLDGQVGGNQFYLRTMGTDDIRGNLARMLWSALLLLSMIVSVYVLSYGHGLHGQFRVRTWVYKLLLAGVIAATCFVDLFDIGRAFPVFNTLVFLAFLRCYQWSHRASDEALSKAWIGLLTFAVFANSLLLKVVLNCQISHYGFCLVIPSALLFCIFVIWFLPRALSLRVGSGVVFRNTMIIVILIFCGRCVSVSRQFYKHKTTAIGVGYDHFLTFPHPIDPRAPFVTAALKILRVQLREDESFVALPEGVMLNYLSRRRNPSRHVNFQPAELLAFGEDEIVQDLAKSAPDFIVLVHKDSAEYGMKNFGQDARYGKKIMSWVDSNYESLVLLGAEPFKGRSFGVKILKRRR